jgi:hypothetical protein
VWTGFIWLKIGMGGSLLQTQYWTSRFHKRSLWMQKASSNDTEGEGAYRGEYFD